jgi:predicted PurR-regulated permease PerM
MGSPPVACHAAWELTDGSFPFTRTTDLRTMTMARRSLFELLGIGLALLLLLFLGRTVLIPLFYALLVALVLYPLVSRLERRGVPRWLAISLGIGLVAVLASLLVLLLAHQVNAFMASLPSAQGPGNSSPTAWLMTWLQRLHVEHRDAWWAPLLDALPGKITPVLGPLLRSLFGMVFNLFIIPVFTALLLYHRQRWVQVLSALVGPAWSLRLPVLLKRIVDNYARFITGMLQVYLIVGALNSAGFLLLGVPSPILFGMLTAVMTMIPYVGILASSLLPISLAYTSTGDIWLPLGVIAVLGIVQYLEANLIFPRIVGGRLGLNTLVSLLVIFAGGALWGVAGMILFLPLVSILKLVSMEVPAWRPLQLLLGDEPRERRA